MKAVYRRYPRRHPLHVQWKRPWSGWEYGSGVRWGILNQIADQGIYFMVECPECGSGPNERCIFMKDGMVRPNFHAARRKMALKFYETLLVVAAGVKEAA